MSKMTNEEWLHTLTTEQLAEVIFNIRFGRYSPWGNVCIEEWLKQPHT